MYLTSRQMPSTNPPKDPPSIGYRLWIVGFVLGILGIVFVTARLCVKKFYVKKLGPDDGFIVAALLFGLAKCIIDIINAEKFQLGVHFVDLDIKRVGLNLSNFGTISTLLYLPAVMCTKLSVLIFYNLIWGVKRWLRYTCWVLEAIVVSYCVTFFFMFTFECQPVAASWNVFLDGKCISNIGLDDAMGAISIVTDFTLLLLPLPLILGLHTGTKQKIGLALTFTTGIFACVASIVREVVVVRALTGDDPSYAQVAERVWPSVELFTGMICACLPPLAPLYNRKGLLRSLVPSSLRSVLSSQRRKSSGISISRTRTRGTSDVQLVDTNTLADAEKAEIPPVPAIEGKIIKKTDIDVEADRSPRSEASGVSRHEKESDTS